MAPTEGRFASLNGGGTTAAVSLANIREQRSVYKNFS